MAKTRGVSDSFRFPPVKAPSECVDCDAKFITTIHTFEDQGEAFVRDHPDNGCHVKLQKTVKTAISPANDER